MKEKTMTVDGLYDYILENMPAEVALRKLLESSLITYNKLKFDKEQNEVHPVIIISMAAMDLGWNFMVEKVDNIEGLVIGSDAYFERHKFGDKSFESDQTH